MQIQIVQSDIDDKEFAEWLSASADVMSMPTHFSSASWKPDDLPNQKATRAMLFLREFEQTVKSRIEIVPQNRNLARIWPTDGVCLEWDRCEPFQNDGFQAGRVYLPTTHQPFGDCFDATKRLYQKVQRWIKKRYMKDLSGRYFIGPDLYQRAVDGRCFPVYGPKGGRIPVGVEGES